MTLILHRLPIPQREELTFVGTEQVRLRPYEIVVWVSVQPRRVPEYEPGLPAFPAILDTGHTHNFSIREDPIGNWARCSLRDFPRLRTIRLRGQPIPLHAANVWLHRNPPGQVGRDPDQPPLRLELPQGIAIHPAASDFPRLPLLGTRALLANRLLLFVDGDRGLVTLRTADWRARLLRWLGG